jgi:hypothetical protein
MVSVLQACYDNVQFCVTCRKNEVTDSMEQIGVRLGCGFSPFLFNL